MNATIEATPASVRKLDGKIEALAPDCLRRRVLEALRQFRASWVELGRFLNEVAYGGDYKEWGYDDFEVYCARELGLKKPTVQKLMISYNYMKKYEAGRLAGLEDGVETGEIVPDYQTVELLDRVRRTENVSDEEVGGLHRRAFTEADGDETALRKELRDKLKPPAARADHIDGGESRRREMAEILKTARHLRRLLSAAKSVPGGLRDRLEQGLTELEALD